MKTEDIQPSKELAPHIAPYREEAPLLSASEVDQLLVRRDLLPNHPPTPSLKREGNKSINVRKIIMTLSGITGLGIAAYFAFFNGPSSNTNRTTVAHKSYLTDQSPSSPDKTHATTAAPIAEKISQK